MKLLSLVIVGIVLCAHTVEAQTVPRWSVDIGVGSGRHNGSAGDVWYDGDRSDVVRLAISRRIGPASRLAPYVSVEASPGETGATLAICIPAPNGSCRRGFPDNEGIGGGVGARLAVTSWLFVGAQVGGGRYRNSARGFAEANVALRLVSHVALASTIRETRWSSQGNAYWYRPLTVGIQIN